MPRNLEKSAAPTMPPLWEGLPEATEFSTVADLERYLTAAVDSFTLVTQQRVLRNARAVMHHLGIGEPFSNWPDPFDRESANRTLHALMDVLRKCDPSHNGGSPRHPR